MTTLNLGRVVGQDGEDGRGIVSIEKTATVGLVDTYTITYTDGTTSTYTVTNGSSGGGGTANYNELENKPSINNVSLQGNKSLSDLGVQPAGNYLTTETDPVFSASASANIASSDITNWNSKQEALVSGTNIKTINNESLLGSGNITIEGGDGSSFEDKDDQRTIKSAKQYKEDGEIKLKIEYNPLVPQTLDTVIIGDKTYRDVFKNANLINANFIDSTDYSGTTVMGNPEISTTVYDTAPSSLKCFGTSSTNFMQEVTVDRNHSCYIACKARLERYSAGLLGVQLYQGGNTEMIGIRTNQETGVFKRFSITSVRGGTTQVYVGASNNANIDGYVDSVVMIDLTELFGADLPAQSLLDQLYENYLLIETGNQPVTDDDEVTYILESTKEDNTPMSGSAAHDLFIQKMNEKAAFLKMENSTFYDASGMSQSSVVSAKDLIKLGVAFMGYSDLIKIANKRAYSFNAGARTITMENAQPRINDYPHSFGKYGHIGRYYNAVYILEHEGVYFVCAFLDLKSGVDRAGTMEALMDEAVAKYNDPNYTVDESKINAYSAAAIVLPEYPEMYEEITDFEYLVDINPTYTCPPASCTKWLTAIVVYDWVKDLKNAYKLDSLDASYAGNTAPAVAEGDIMSYEDAIHLMLLPSQNTASDALAKHTGYIINKYLEMKNV